MSCVLQGFSGIAVGMRSYLLVQVVRGITVEADGICDYPLRCRGLSDGFDRVIPQGVVPSQGSFMDARSVSRTCWSCEEAACLVQLIVATSDSGDLLARSGKLLGRAGRQKRAGPWQSLYKPHFVGL